MKLNKHNFIYINNIDENEIKPPGYVYIDSIQDESNNKLEIHRKLEAKAWQTATSPLSSLFMNFVLFYFIGSSISIYSFVMFFSVISSQIKNIVGVSEKFEQFQNKGIKEIVFYKFVYLSINIILLVFSLYKLYHVGLLPLSVIVCMSCVGCCSKRDTMCDDLRFEFKRCNDL